MGRLGTRSCILGILLTLLTGCVSDGKLKDRIDIRLGPFCKIDTEDTELQCERKF